MTEVMRRWFDSDQVEVLALLTKHEVRAALEQTVGQATEDVHDANIMMHNYQGLYCLISSNK